MPQHPSTLEILPPDEPDEYYDGYPSDDEGSWGYDDDQDWPGDDVQPSNELDGTEPDHTPNFSLTYVGLAPAAPAPNTNAAPLESDGEEQRSRVGQQVGQQVLGYADPRFVSPRTASEARQFPGVDTAMLPPVHDAHLNLDDQAAASPAEVVKAIETQHYARRAPDFDRQVEDADRTNTFRYRPSLDSAPIEMTEHDGLTELRSFLEARLEAGEPKEYLEDLRDIRDNLTFIGEKELAEASAGLAALWKGYLNEHPDNTLCLVTLKNDNGEGKQRKSGPYLIGRVLDNFSDEELEAYAGRIIDEPARLPATGADPEHTRIVLVDDWSISRNQLGRMVYEYVDVPEVAPYLGLAYMDNEFEKQLYVKNVEVNLITARGGMLVDGVEAHLGAIDATARLQVKSYYKSHEVYDKSYVASRTTGIHSDVDHGFRDTIRDARVALMQGPEAQYLPMPPLTQIERVYRVEQPRVVIESDGTLSRTAHPQ